MSAAGESDRAGSWTPVRCNQRMTAVKTICSAWRGALDSKIHSSLQVEAIPARLHLLAMVDESDDLRRREREPLG